MEDRCGFWFLVFRKFGLEESMSGEMSGGRGDRGYFRWGDRVV